MKRLLVIGGGILVGGVLLYFILNRPAPKPGSATPHSAGSATTQLARPPAKAVVDDKPGPVTGKVAAAESSTNANASDDWMERIEGARAVEESDADKSVRLLALFPTLPPEGQDEIAAELAALTPDANFSALTGILTDIRTPESVLDVLLTDLLDRPESVQLPLLLDVAKTPDHPRSAEAIDMLASALGENLGTDWAAWSKKISEQLASRPEK